LLLFEPITDGKNTTLEIKHTQNLLAAAFTKYPPKNMGWGSDRMNMSRRK
jgi:hypothetical protein